VEGSLFIKEGMSPELGGSGGQEPEALARGKTCSACRPLLNITRKEYAVKRGEKESGGWLVHEKFARIKRKEEGLPITFDPGLRAGHAPRLKSTSQWEERCL